MVDYILRSYHRHADSFTFNHSSNRIATMISLPHVLVGIRGSRHRNGLGLVGSLVTSRASCRIIKYMHEDAYGHVHILLSFLTVRRPLVEEHWQKTSHTITWQLKLNQNTIPAMCMTKALQLTMKSKTPPLSSMSMPSTPMAISFMKTKKKSPNCTRELGWRWRLCFF